MGTDLESNTAVRTEVSCLDLSRSCDRNLELENVSMVPRDSHFPFTSRTQHHGGVFVVQKLPARFKSEDSGSDDRVEPFGPDIGKLVQPH